MKKKLQELLAQKEAEKAELLKRSDAATDVNELRSINEAMPKIIEEIATFRSMIDGIPEEVPAGGESTLPEGRSQIPGASTHPIARQVLASYGMQQQEQRDQVNSDPYDTMEYRQAFMAFAKTGEIRPELRANATTTTADISAVIPTTILNEIIKKVTVYGQVFSRVRKLSIQGGIEVPILTLKPTATWIGETTTSDKQKVQANTKITFSYYALECKVATSLLASTVSLDSFESMIIELIAEAMVKAIDMAVIKGTGSGQPLGLTNDSRVPSAQVVTMTPAQFSSWESWMKEVFAKMPGAYKEGASLFMASGTFEGYINGMVDKDGQPIARVNYGITNGSQGRFCGRDIVEVEDDVIAPFAAANEGDVVAIYCNLKNYAFNSNMEMKMFHYLDHNTNEWVDKAILQADGKLIDPYGIVIVKKGAAS